MEFNQQTTQNFQKKPEQQKQGPHHRKEQSANPQTGAHREGESRYKDRNNRWDHSFQKMNNEAPAKQRQSENFKKDPANERKNPHKQESDKPVQQN